MGYGAVLLRVNGKIQNNMQEDLKISCEIFENVFVDNSTYIRVVYLYTCSINFLENRSVLDFLNEIGICEITKSKDSKMIVGVYKFIQAGDRFMMDISLLLKDIHGMYWGGADWVLDMENACVYKDYFSINIARDNMKPIDVVLNYIHIIRAG